jgi:uncharacterized GH25 family protein
MIKRSIFILALALAFGSSALLAHDLWTDADNPAPGKPFSLIVGYGHDYPTWEAIPDEEYGLFKVKLTGPKGDVPVSPGSPNYVWQSSGNAEEGTYLAIADVAPVFWTKTPEGWSMKPKNETPGGLDCGRFIESAKGVVAVGNGGSDSAVTKPAGLPLEIVPGKNPLKAKPGEAIPLTVLLSGKPLAAAKVNARYAGFDKVAGSADAQAFSSVTDKDGKLNFVPLVAGEWIVTVRSEAPYSDLKACDKDDYGTSLHFKIN